MLNKRKWAILLAVVLLVSLSAVLVEFAMHYPSPLGSIVVPVDYPAIQKAIDNAPIGCTIYVRNGVYNELLTINKSLTLIGENNQNTIIKGHTRYPLNSVTIEIEANDVTISNFNINGYETGIEITQEFSNCKITQNIIQNYTTFGIIAQWGSNQIISQNTIIGKNEVSNGISFSSKNSLISENSIQNNGIGMYIQSSNVTINGNTIKNNGYVTQEFPSKSGLLLVLPGPYNVFGNNITGNQGAGIKFEGGNNTIIHDNYIAENQAGIFLLNYVYFNTSVGSKIRVFQNNIMNNQEQVIVSKVLMGSPTHIEANTINGTDTVSWDNGTVGNYWSNYQSRYTDATQNSTTGTYNTPYTIDTNNKDNHPLIQAAKTQLPQQ